MYCWFLRLTCLLYISISLSEVPDFDAVVGATRDGVVGPEKQGKLWYELLLESACIVGFAIDIVIQVRGLE